MERDKWKEREVGNDRRRKTISMWRLTFFAWSFVLSKTIYTEGELVKYTRNIAGTFAVADVLLNWLLGLIIVYLGGIAILFLSAVMTLTNFKTTKLYMQVTSFNKINFGLIFENQKLFFANLTFFELKNIFNLNLNNNFNNILLFFNFNLI